jgi:NAD(P)-dependent dehydrogenase (short-subunit alcohol dehydrogenase family)
MTPATTSPQDSHVAITGGSRGIGLAIAERFVGKGCRVSVLARTSSELESARAHLQSRTPGAEVEVAIVDVTDEGRVAEAFQGLRQRLGPVTILVNNAGAAESVPLKSASLEHWNRMWSVNVTSAFLCSRAVIPDMLAKKSGKIVSVASTAGLKGYPYVSAYCAAKHGLVGFTRSLALEVKPHGITVNAVCPGYTETDLLRKAVENAKAKTGQSEEEIRASFLNQGGQTRLLQPGEVADKVLWLCAPEQRELTGETIEL